MGDTWQRESSHRIAKAVLHTEGVQRGRTSGSPLLPTRLPDNIDTVVIVGIEDPDDSILLVHTVIPDASGDGWNGQHVWGAEHTIRHASTWPGLYGRHYGRPPDNPGLLYLGSHVPGETVPPGAQVVPLHRIHGVEYVMQFFRFSLPTRRADAQITDCTPQGYEVL